MAESTLSMSIADLKAEVGDYAGYGRDPDLWDDDQAARIESTVKAGLRRFYWPTFPPGQPAHDWNFLRPLGSLTTVSDQDDYDLPDDFGGLAGELTYSAQDGWISVAVCGEGQIRALRQRGTTSGLPQFAAIRPNKSAGAGGQRWQLLLWPTPAGDYGLAFPYNLLPDALTTARPWPYGGAVHAETLLASCLAVYEERYDDTPGVHAGAFARLLMVSVEYDRRILTPASLGYNGAGGGQAMIARVNGVTVNGTQY